MGSQMAITLVASIKRTGITYRGGGAPDAGTLRADGFRAGVGTPTQVSMFVLESVVAIALTSSTRRCTFPEHERRLLVRAGPAAPQHSGPQARHGSSHISLLMSVTRPFTHVTSSSCCRGGPSLGLLVALLSLTTAWCRLATREDAAPSAQDTQFLATSPIVSNITLVAVCH